LLKDALLRRVLASHEAELPLELESDSRELINEYGGTQSHLDGVLRLNGLSVVVESKLTEPLSVNMSESKFSRCLSGRAKLSPEERKKLAKHLGFPLAWLFQQVSPPPRTSRTDDFKSRAAADCDAG
jgi:hypothetical protein